VEAAGIEHFADTIKSIRYKAAVPKSCLKFYFVLEIHAKPVSDGASAIIMVNACLCESNLQGRSSCDPDRRH
jgi:hypothetical protein